MPRVFRAGGWQGVVVIGLRCMWHPLGFQMITIIIQIGKKA
jgi:hypothetical protein